MGMNTNGAKNWMVVSYSPWILHLTKGPVSWQEAMLLIEEERNLGLDPHMDYVPEVEPQTWQGIDLDEPSGG